MADEPTETPGAEAPADGSVDHSTWFEGAGLDASALPDPVEIVNARAHWDKYGGETELFNSKQLEEKARTLIEEHYRNPETYNGLKEHFRSELQAELTARSKETPATESDEATPWKPGMTEMESRLGQRLGPIEQALTQLLGQRTEAEKEQKDAEWQTGFNTRVEEAAKRGNNGVLQHEAVVERMKELYGLGKIPDDSPAALARAVKDVIQAKLAERDGWARQMGVAGLLQSQQLQVPPEMKIEDVVADDDRMQKLLSHVMNYNMPPDPPE